MTRSAFPSPADIRRQTPQEIFSHQQAEYLFNNLTKEFEKNAVQGLTRQNILIRRYKSCPDSHEAAWIEWHRESPEQRQYSIDYCNQKLSTSGWRINNLDFTKVLRYQGSANHGSDMKIWAIVAEMEYICGCMRG